MDDNWRIWEKDNEYGELLYLRATGKLEEMESSKAVTKIVCRRIKQNDLILDVGCGCGHYIVSLDKTLNAPFSYHGIDATSYYIELAQKAFLKEENENHLRLNTKFETGDIFNLPVQNNYADIVMCNNLFLHLPSIKKPLKELWRSTKKIVIIRALIGKTSFRIKQINPPEEYTDDGEPLNFHYFNIYSENYLVSLAEKLDNFKSCEFIEDKDFNAEKIGMINYKDQKAPHDLTTIVNDMQVNNYIIQPWQFFIIEKK